MEPPSEAILIACLIVLSSIFSGSETALTSLGATRVARLLDDLKAKRKRHTLLEAWHKNPNRVLVSVLIGNNIVNIGASALATELSYELITSGEPGGSQGELALAIAVGLMTFLILIFGEIVPKTIAKHNAERFLSVVRILTGFYIVLYPFTVVLEQLTRGLVRLFGGSVSAEGPIVTDEDIESLIKLGGLEGSLDEHKGELRSSVLEFDDTLVKEVLVPRPDMVAFEVNDPFDKIVSVIKDQRFSRYPVYEDSVDHIVGVFFVKDMLEHLNGHQMERFDLRVILRPPVFVPETKRISELMRELQVNKVHMAIVVDEFGGTAGIVTIEDIIEEIFGEIYDEYDVDEEPDIQKQQDGTFVADARASIRDLEHTLGVAFPDDSDYETLGGFIVMHAGKVPVVQEQIRWNGLVFTVLDADNTKVSRVNIEPAHGEAHADTETSA